MIFFFLLLLLLLVLLHRPIARRPIVYAIIHTSVKNKAENKALFSKISASSLILFYFILISYWTRERLSSSIADDVLLFLFPLESFISVVF